MLNDMEQRSLMILSTLISMKQMKSGEIIYKKGQNGEFCYIIVKGLVKVRWY
jgi:CRP-like cAMP-binding protein